MPTGEAKKSGILKSDDRNVGEQKLSTSSKTVKYEGKAGSPSGKNVQKETDSQEKSESKDSKISGVVSK